MIISNLKQFKGLGHILKMRINEVNREGNVKVRNDDGKSQKFREDGIKISSEVPSNVFEYIESEIGAEIESSFMNCYVCYSSKPLNAVDLKLRLRSEGIKDAAVLKVNCLTYYVNKCEGEDWLETDIQTLKNCLIIPRAVDLECIGLPVQAWQEKT